MGTITVTIADDAERWLRQSAGKGKGKLGAKLTEVIQLAQKDIHDDEAATRLLAMMRRGFPLGIKKFSRAELHER